MAGTIIGQGIIIEGELTADEDVEISGTVRGKVSAEGPVAIESGATLEADVRATTVSVAGSVTGDVTASERVDLLTGGRLVGNVKTARITIADGASFKGNVDMDV